MSFISMDLLGPYSEMDNENQYTLTVNLHADQLCSYGTYKTKNY